MEIINQEKSHQKSLLENEKMVRTNNNASKFSSIPRQILSIVQERKKIVGGGAYFIQDFEKWIFLTKSSLVNGAFWTPINKISVDYVIIAVEIAYISINESIRLVSEWLKDRNLEL